MDLAVDHFSFHVPLSSHLMADGMRTMWPIAVSHSNCSFPLVRCQYFACKKLRDSFIW